MFHVTNPTQMRDGAAPAVEERGPFVYYVEIVNEVIGFREEFGEIEFRRRKKYVFDADASQGTEVSQIDALWFKTA